MSRNTISYDLFKCQCRKSNENESYQLKSNLQRLGQLYVDTYSCIASNYIKFIQGRDVLSKHLLNQFVNQVQYIVMHSKLVSLQFTNNLKDFNANNFYIPSMDDDFNKSNMLLQCINLDINMDFINFVKLHVYDFDSLYSNSILSHSDNLHYVSNILNSKNNK